MTSPLLRALRLAGRELRPVLVSGAEADGARLRVTEAPAVFELVGEVPSGWVGLRLDIGAGEAVGRARVIADLAGGAKVMPLVLRKDGAGAAVLWLPGTARALRLEIDRPGAFDPPRIMIREVTRSEAAGRLAIALLARRLREPSSLPVSMGKLLVALRRGGIRAVADRLLHNRERGYPEWRSAFDSLTEADRTRIRARAARLATRFSLLVATREAPQQLLERTIESVRAQLHPGWELCLAGTWKAALLKASGDFVLRLEPGDELSEHALYLMAEEVALHPETDLVYGDGDKLDASGRYFDPHFKPDWNPDLLLSHDYIGRPCALRRVRVLEAAAAGDESSHDRELCLRIGGEGRVRHVPFVLCHERPGDPGATGAAALGPVRRYLGEEADVEPGPLPGTCRVRWHAPDPAPLVTLIVPTRDGRRLLERCVESVLRTAGDRRLELVVVDNQSRAPDALAYLSQLESTGAARVLRFDQPFNFSAINNLAVREARGAVVGLLNNDVEAVEAGWLEEMVSHALRPAIGAVGARLLYPDRTVQHGGIILGVGGVAGHAHKYASERDAGYFQRAQLVQDLSAVTAACLLVRRETYLRAGGLDETLSVAFNDVDFCLRVRKLGLRNLWTPFATLLHHESKTRGADDTRHKRRRFRAEQRLMIARWGEELLHDPAYNPNLTLESEDFALGWPPRVHRPWDPTA